MSSEPPPAESRPEVRTAADLMDRQPPAVLPDATVGDVARLIVERHVSGVPVVARSGEVVGLVTEGYLAEGKRFAMIAVGCTGGKHRSVAMVEQLAARLGATGLAVSVVHRDLGRE